jgi:2-polyprenyl-3-methyl-5-hydroxy-6-metoxy-1,4-benzoquinol methylase
VDVLEHIQPEDEGRFLGNIVDSLTPEGICLIGTPSLESQVYASKASKEGHVNCKTAPELKALMQRYFHSVFLFSMNDEVVHTGYHKLAHYLFALCAHRKL